MTDNSKLLIKRDEFITSTCKYIANIIISIETDLYRRVSEKKSEDKFDVLKTNNITAIVSKSLENKFNSLFCNIIDEDELDKKYVKLLSYFNHSKLGFLYTLAPTCVDIHLSINRTKLNTQDEDDYINSLSILLNDKLNEEYNNVLTKFIKEIMNNTYTDDMISSKDIQTNRVPFTFTIKN